MDIRKYIATSSWRPSYKYLCLSRMLTYPKPNSNDQKSHCRSIILNTTQKCKVDEFHQYQQMPYIMLCLLLLCKKSGFILSILFLYLVCFFGENKLLSSNLILLFHVKTISQLENLPKYMFFISIVFFDLRLEYHGILQLPSLPH